MRRFALAAGLGLLAAAPLAAQTTSASFLGRLGNDTISAERFTRTATHLEGEIVSRSPRTSYRRYVADFGLSGSVTRFEVTVPRPGAPADAPPLQSAVATFAGDSIHLEVRRGDSVLTSAIPAGFGVAPLLSGAFAPFELLTMRARASRRDSIAIPAYFVGGRGPAPVVIRRLGRDSVLMATPTTLYRVAVDDAGRIMGLRAPGATQQIQLERLGPLDIAGLAAAWAARDAQGQGMGTLSPRDTVRATIGGASLLVDYGRPRMRGREIFGNVVPWGQVWRSGANAATQLVVSRDIAIGTLAVPAGTYTLWTLPTPSGWQLIVNRQYGQWGTEYDASRDLGRVPMTVAPLTEPVENCTIAIESQGAGGVLSITWERTRAQIPFTVR